MPEEKTENKFLRFFQRNRKIFLPFKYFVYLVGIVMIILFVLDFSSHKFLKEELLEINWDEDFGHYHYEPYLDFGHPYRKTKNPCKNISENPLLIYTFGGSTMWGDHAEYYETIASYISELLCREGIPTEVKNFGIKGYLNTQEIIRLFLELGDGNVPNITVFYDGANEIGFRGSYITTPLAFDYLYHRMDYQRSIFPSLREYISRHFRGTDQPPSIENDILDGYFSKFQLRTDGLDGEELYEKVMKIYLNNVKIVKSMEKDWGFKSFFYWQPTIYYKIGNLSYEEELYLYKYQDDLELFRLTDPIVTEFLNNAKYVRDLRKILSNRSETVFVDSCHILPENNNIIAEEMVEDIMKYLKEKGYYEEK